MKDYEGEKGIIIYYSGWKLLWFKVRGWFQTNPLAFKHKKKIKNGIIRFTGRKDE